jgi:hypothetical protein
MNLDMNLDMDLEKHRRAAAIIQVLECSRLMDKHPTGVKHGNFVASGWQLVVSGRQAARGTIIHVGSAECQP